MIKSELISRPMFSIRSPQLKLRQGLFLYGQLADSDLIDLDELADDELKRLIARIKQGSRLIHVGDAVLYSPRHTENLISFIQKTRATEDISELCFYTKADTNIETNSVFTESVVKILDIYVAGGAHRSSLKFLGFDISICPEYSISSRFWKAVWTVFGHSWNLHEILIINNNFFNGVVLDEKDIHLLVYACLHRQVGCNITLLGVLVDVLFFPILEKLCAISPTCITIHYRGEKHVFGKEQCPGALVRIERIPILKLAESLEVQGPLRYSDTHTPKEIETYDYKKRKT